MKQFFKFFTASCLGTIAALGLLTVISMIVVGAMSAKDTSVKAGTILDLDLNRIIPEKSGNVDQGFSMEPTEAIGIRDIKKILRKAATDDNIEGILLSHKNLNLGQATILSILNELKEFKESGKFVYAYGDYFSQSAYMLNSVSDSIFLNPNGMVDVKGYASMIPFFKDGMNKLGVKMEIFYAGNFKSATEPFRRNDMSEPNKLQTRAFLDGMLKVFQDEITSSRNLSVSQLDDIMNEYKGVNAKSSLDAGLVDALIYKDDLEVLLKNKLGVDLKKQLSYINLEEYKTKISITESGSFDKRIAIVYAEGNVGYDSDAKGAITDKKYMEIFDKIRRDDKIKAVVLRVNSGGGSALTSDIIYKEIEHLKSQGVPVVSSFGDLAASGGYYIAANSDTIVSMPNTLTGSIGVFSMMPNFTELTDKKMGIHFDSVKTHQFAINMTPFMDMTESEKRIMQSETDAIYDQFLQRVADGRGMTVEAVHEVAQGRVWTGTKGKEIGLVDVIGDLEDAIEIAKDMANIDEYRIKEYPIIKKEWYEDMIKALSQSSTAQMALPNNRYSNAVMQEYKQMQSLLNMTGPQAKLPYIYDFN